MTCINQPHFKSILGEFKLCEKMALFDHKRYQELHPKTQKAKDTKQEKKPKQEKKAKEEKPKEAGQRVLFTLPCAHASGQYSILGFWTPWQFSPSKKGFDQGVNYFNVERTRFLIILGISRGSQRSDLPLAFDQHQISSSIWHVYIWLKKDFNHLSWRVLSLWRHNGKCSRTQKCSFLWSLWPILSI